MWMGAGVNDGVTGNPIAIGWHSLVGPMCVSQTLSR